MFYLSQKEQKSIRPDRILRRMHISIKWVREQKMFEFGVMNCLMRSTNIHRTAQLWCFGELYKKIGRYDLPFFEIGTVTEESYKNMPSQYAFPYFSRLWSDQIFILDGASPDYSNNLRIYLSHKIPGNWISRERPLRWSPNSPDLTLCDFFLWASLKSNMYKTLVETLEKL